MVTQKNEAGAIFIVALYTWVYMAADTTGTAVSATVNILNALPEKYNESNNIGNNNWKE